MVLLDKYYFYLSSSVLQIYILENQLRRHSDLPNHHSPNPSSLLQTIAFVFILFASWRPSQAYPHTHPPPYHWQ